MGKNSTTLGYKKVHNCLNDCNSLLLYLIKEVKPILTKFGIH